MSQFNYLEVPVSSIAVPADMARSQPFHRADISRLQQTIAFATLLSPIGVTPPDEGGTRTLVFGLGRLLAFILNSGHPFDCPTDSGLVPNELINSQTDDDSGKALDIRPESYNGYTTIPAVEISDIDTFDRRMVALIENLARADLSPIDQADTLHELKGEYEAKYPKTRRGSTGGGNDGKGTRTKTEIADSAEPGQPCFVAFMSDLLRIPERTIYETLSLHKLSRKNRELLRSGKLSKSSAIKAVALQNLPTDELLAVLAEKENKRRTPAVVGGQSTPQLYRELIAQHRRSVWDNTERADDEARLALTAVYSHIRALRLWLRTAFYQGSVQRLHRDRQEKLRKRLIWLIFRTERLLGEHAELKHYEWRREEAKLRQHKRDEAAALKKAGYYGEKTKGGISL